MTFAKCVTHCKKGVLVKTKIGQPKEVSAGFINVTADEFFKEMANGDFFFDNVGARGHIRNLENVSGCISFYKDINCIPNPKHSLGKNSEFFRLERGKNIILLSQEDTAAGLAINFFIHPKE
jgi:hypothetical protein